MHLAHCNGLDPHTYPKLSLTKRSCKAKPKVNNASAEPTGVWTNVLSTHFSQLLNSIQRMSSALP